MINWGARLRNWAFWISLTSALCLVLVQFGVQVDSEWVMQTVKAVLAVLTILGVIIDPSSPGLGDK